MLTLCKEIGETLAERIEREEQGLRESNITTIENFLTEFDGESLTLQMVKGFSGIRFISELSWTYTRDQKEIEITDLGNDNFGLLEIPLGDLLESAERDLFDNNVLKIELVDNTILEIRVED